MGKINFTGKLAAALLAAALVALPSDGIHTNAASGTDYDSKISEYEDKIASIKKDNEQRQTKINEYNGDISENKEAMDTISAQIDGVNSEITTYGELITAKQDKITEKILGIQAVEKAVEAKEQEIEDKKVQIAALEEENEQNLKKFSKLARALYMNDSSDTIPLLNGSDDWYNFFVYSDVIKNISSQNLNFMNNLLASIHDQENMIEELNGDIDKLQQEKASLKEEQQQLEVEKQKLENEKGELQKHVDEQTANLYNIAAQNQQLIDKVYSLTAQIDASNEEVEELNAALEKAIREKQAANSGQVVYSTDGFRWPLDKQFQLITTYFGYDAWRSGNHYGIDVGNAGIGGNNIYAAQSGTVITAYNDGGYHGGFGNYVVIDHGNGVSTLYAHCRSTVVVEGQKVNKGDVIGYVGTTGWSTGNHLHFEVRINGVSTNPFNYGYEYV
ncbi:MAG: murein hydrolase activator EnvC family protein [Oscillospiraceae bacterium]